MKLIADNLTVTNRTIADALEARRPEPLFALAERARQTGAEYLDVNLGPRGRDLKEKLSFTLDVLAECWASGILIDTTEPELMDFAARHWRSELILNGFSGEISRAGVIEVARDHGLDLVVFLMDITIPTTLEDKLEMAARLVGQCSQAGIGPERILVDPVVVPLGWGVGQEHSKNFLELLRRLPSLFGDEIRSVAGISNLFSGAAGAARADTVERAFVAAACGAGLTHALLDIDNAGLIETARTLDVVEGRRLFAPSEFE